MEPDAAEPIRFSIFHSTSKIVRYGGLFKIERAEIVGSFVKFE